MNVDTLSCGDAVVTAKNTVSLNLVLSVRKTTCATFGIAIRGHSAAFVDHGVLMYQSLDHILYL